MDDVSFDVLEYVDRIEYPVSKEELINGLLLSNAPGNQVALVERLPGHVYQSADEIRAALDEITHVRSSEVLGAESYDDYLDVVIRHVGDVAHATKETYRRSVDEVMRAAVTLGTLDIEKAADIEKRLGSAFADLRGSMTEVTNDSAPVNPLDDAPKMRT